MKKFIVVFMLMLGLSISFVNADDCKQDILTMKKGDKLNFYSTSAHELQMTSVLDEHMGGVMVFKGIMPNKNEMLFGIQCEDGFGHNTLTMVIVKYKVYGETWKKSKKANVYFDYKNKKWISREDPDERSELVPIKKTSKR